MEFKIKRDKTKSGPGYSVGGIYLEECGRLCHSLEPEDRGLTQSMPLAEIKAKKVPNNTAIPRGRYEVKMMLSPSFKDKSYAKPYGGFFPCLQNVPGFSGVLIHPGNYAPGSPGAPRSDTRGCILPGDYSDSRPGIVTGSQLAYSDLMKFYLWPAHLRGEKIYVTIE